MIVYVDMSAKVEHWNTDSVVAISNGMTKSYLISAKIKQVTRRFLQDQYGDKHLTYRVMALFVYIAMGGNLHGVNQVLIDRDYTGDQIEGTIKNFLLPLLRQEKPDVDAGFILFRNVKGSRADLLARAVLQRQAEPTRLITWIEIETIMNQQIHKK